VNSESLHNTPTEKCFACGNTVIFYARKEQHNHFICTLCGSISAEEFDIKLGELYSDLSGYSGSIHDLETGNFKISKRLSQFLHEIHRVSGPGVTLLDIGCSTGSFLQYASDIGFHPEGIDASPSLASQARKAGFGVLSAEFDEKSFPNRIFGVITAFDVIEHVRSPKHFLSESVKLMDENSFLIVKTPNMTSRWAKLSKWGFEWLNIPCSILTPPHHVSNLSDIGLDILARDCGLKLEKSFEVGCSFLYELGQLHLLRDFRHKASFTTGMKMLLGYSYYTLCLALLIILKRKPSTDFSMIKIYKRIG
jgi:SAM-dependent methyltransferase